LSGRKGDILHNETIFPHAPQNETGMAMKKIKSLVNSCNIEAISIGKTAVEKRNSLSRKLVLIEIYRFCSF
jgi:uncharacterized protein